MIKLLSFWVITCGIICSSFTNAQLVTSTAYTPQQLVQNVLTGGGVSISNVTFTGSNNAIGYFDGTNCNIGLDSGVILTTGTILNTNGSGIPEGPFGPNNESGAGVDNNEPGYPLLATLSGPGNLSFNAAILEFDFVPQSDSVKFNFVFGSEEYPEFVNSVNDAFGFFISGPNPAGGNYADENIALVPGTNLPITINNVNAATNSAYFIDNGDGSQAPQNSSNTYVQYDGFTKVLEAKAKVTCGETYHLIIAITDIQDGILDSGVFLEAGSFTSPGIDISANLSFQTSLGNDSTLVEGCGSADLWFVRSDSIPFSQSIPLDISGTATQGTDYPNLPSSIVFPPGEDSVSLNISAYFDGISEPLESLQIKVQIPSNCSNVITDSIILYIMNVDSLQVEVLDAQINCPNESVTLSTTVHNGNPGYSYLWTTGETTPQITVSPTSTTNYGVTVTDTCGQVANGVATVTVLTYQPISITAFSDTTIHCANANIQLTASSSGGANNHVISWSNGVTGNTIQVNVNQTTEYIATVTDQCGNTAKDTVTVTLTELPITTVISNDTLICKGDSVQLVVTPSGGVGSYVYQWSSGQTDSLITVAPSSNTEYVVSVSDDCGYIKARDTVNVNLHVLTADFVATGLMEEGGVVQFNNLSTGAVNYQWDLGNDETSTLTHPSTIYENSGTYIVSLIATNEVGCIDSISKPIQIRPEFSFYAPNAFTPDGDEFNQTWKLVIRGIDLYNFDLFIYNRWGEVVWESHNLDIGWDGTYRGRPVEAGTYVWKAQIKFPYNDDRKTYNGHLTLLRGGNAR